MKNNKTALKLLEKEFKITSMEDNQLLLETHTSTGLDIGIIIDKDDIIESFIEAVDFYDIEEEIDCYRSESDDEYSKKYSYEETEQDFKEFVNKLQDMVEQFKN